MTEEQRMFLHAFCTAWRICEEECNPERMSQAYILEQAWEQYESFKGEK